VPAFTLKDAEGKPVGFTPGTDALTVLEVWAPTWFEQSDEQFQRLQELHERFGNRGVRILCLAYETDPPRVRQAIADHAALFDVALGEEATFDKLELQSLPTTWILDRQGRPLQRLEGFHPLEVLEKHLEEALSGPSEE
jgi:cytochrome c-type biogenesis protein